MYVRHDDTFARYLNHINGYENDLSGESLCDSLGTSCIRVTADDNVNVNENNPSSGSLCDSLASCLRAAADDDDGDGLKWAGDSDVYSNDADRRSVLRMQATVQQSVLQHETLSRR